MITVARMGVHACLELRASDTWFHIKSNQILVAQMTCLSSHLIGEEYQERSAHALVTRSVRLIGVLRRASWCLDVKKGIKNVHHEIYP